MIAEGDIVALRLTERETHDGALLEIELTGNAFETQTMAFLRLEDGTVAEWWIQPDTLGFLQQLGVDPEDLGAAVSAGGDCIRLVSLYSSTVC